MPTCRRLTDGYKCFKKNNTNARLLETHLDVCIDCEITTISIVETLKEHCRVDNSLQLLEGLSEGMVLNHRIGITLS